MPKLVWLNGETMPLDSAVVSAQDHAHLYGDGIFEGIRIYDRKIFKLDEHLRRLLHGAAYMGFEMSMGFDDLKRQILTTCREADLDNGYIRLNVTRGTGLGLDPKRIDRAPNVMIMVSSLNLYPPEAFEVGLQIITSSYRVIHADALDPKLKCIGRYASNIMAKAEANRMNAGEALMLNNAGQVAECTGDNLFLVKHGKISTPHPTCGILLGITRETVIQLARADGIEVEESFLTIYDVTSAEECFLTGTAAEVIPVVGLDNRKIGCGTPGRVTQRIMDLFRVHTATGVPFDA
jgi:branched-chain amino acid aminotransferase